MGLFGPDSISQHQWVDFSEIYVEIHGNKRINPTDVGDRLTCPSVPTGPNFHSLNKVTL